MNSTDKGIHMTTVHLHVLDYPDTIRILSELKPGRHVDGFTALPTGADVDWFVLQNGTLSTSEKAVVAIARAIAACERYGEFPGNEAVRRAVADAFKNLR